MTGLPSGAMNGSRSPGRATASATDAELVEACAQGDQAAFAHIYDRYSDRVFSFCLTLTRDRGLAEDAMADTFVTAWQRMGQLRDPGQLRSWLFAIAKNRVSRLGSRASRQVPVDPAGAEMRNALDPDVSAPDTDVTDALSGEAATALVWEAAEGLNENERAVLELSVRQGIEGEELAAALGVSRHNANVIASRMRQNLERSLGALFLLRYNDDGCPVFSQLVADHSGALTPLWRKRISRHADGCSICSVRRAPKALALFGESPVSAAPISARSEILGSLPVTPEGLPLPDFGSFRADRNGFPTGSGMVRRVLVGLGVATVAIAVLTMGTIRATHDGGGATREQGARVVGSIEATSETTTTTLEGDTASGTASGGVSAAAPVAPGGLPSSGGSGTGSNTGGSTVAPSTTATRDTSAPKIITVSLSSQALISSQIQCTTSGERSAVLTVTASDNVGVVSGQATIEVNGVQNTFKLTGSGSKLSGTVGPFTKTGSFTIQGISVVDAAGNRSAVWSTPIAGRITC